LKISIFASFSFEDQEERRLKLLFYKSDSSWDFFDRQIKISVEKNSGKNGVGGVVSTEKNS